MSFIIDKQSLDDLNLLGKYRPNSVFSLFNQVKTSGGEKLLEQIFRTPLHDADKINERTSNLKYFQEKELQFPFSKDIVDLADQYLTKGGEGGFLPSALHVFQAKMRKVVFRSDEYDKLLTGLHSAMTVLGEIAQFLGQLKDDGHLKEKGIFVQVQNIFSQPRFAELLNSGTNISFLEVARNHYFLTTFFREEMQTVLNWLYELDVYITVANVVKSKGLGYAKAFSADENRLTATKLRHVGLENAISNTIDLDCSQNVLFLTGANMAGKSTWMKTIGSSLYLAHIGMPIAAESFDFSIKEGIYSSINVPDNLDLGYSHFYAEVLRVKEVAQQVGAGRNLFVLFDELFKGTNVKDAYDATLAVSEAFAQYTNCLFVISTHIIEVGEALHERCDNIQFRYLPTILEGSIPRYTYQLKDGITSDRQGMMMIMNENILEIIEGGS